VIKTVKKESHGTSVLGVLKLYHTKNNKERELVASVLCLGHTQPYALTLYCNHMRNEADPQYREQFW
jgi:hypothetical protein